MQTVSPYKTAAELGIRQWEHDGLVALIGPLSQGVIRLDMRDDISTCGTVGCIGGHLAVLIGRKPSKYVCSRRSHDTLSSLFYPDHDMAWRASSLQGAAAIVNFLTLGDPRWDDVMRGA